MLRRVGFLLPLFAFCGAAFAAAPPCEPAPFVARVPFLAEQTQAPMLFHFGEHDPSITAHDIEAHREHQEHAEIHVYPAGHGFNCDQRPDFERHSATLALERTLAFLRRALHPAY